MYVFSGLIGDVLGSVTSLVDGLLGIIFKEVIPYGDIHSNLHRLRTGDNPTKLFQMLTHRFKTSFYTILVFNVENYSIDLTNAEKHFRRISQMNDDKVPLRDLVDGMGCLKSRMSGRLLEYILESNIRGKSPTFKQVMRHIKLFRRGNGIFLFDFFSLYDNEIIEDIPLHVVLGKFGKRFGPFDVFAFKNYAKTWKKSVPMQAFLTAIQSPSNGESMWKHLSNHVQKVHGSKSGSKGILGRMLNGKSNNSGKKPRRVLGGILGGLKNHRNHPRFQRKKPTKSSKSSRKTLDLGGILG